MKNYQYRLILVLFVVSSIIITSLGIFFSLMNYNDPKTILNFTLIALSILSICSIAIAIYTKKRIMDPMTRMLKSAVQFENNGETTEIENSNDNDYEIQELVTNLKEKHNEANVRKIQTDNILKNLTDGVIVFDMKGNVNYINPVAIQMLEINDSQSNFNEIFSKYDDINMEKIVYLDIWSQNEKKTVKNINNSQGTLELKFVSFRDAINRPIGVMVVIQDITEHVKLDEMRKTFVANVSHELKTPLTSIKGFSETLLDGDCDKETEMHFLKIINDNADRMKALVDDLLTLSKYDNKVNKTNLIEFDLGVLAKTCAEKFEIEVKKRNQNMSCFVTADVPMIYADKDGIERVIINIISNSIKYTQEGGNIDIYVGFLHNDAYIKIKDTGIGIPKDDIEKVFDRFYRVDKARSREMGGTGLGLSIAKEIIEQNKGNIDIKSELGKGTEVIIRMPVAKK